LILLLTAHRSLFTLDVLELDGQRLSLAQVAAVANGDERVALSAAARQRVEAARRVVEKIVAEEQTV